MIKLETVQAIRAQRVITPEGERAATVVFANGVITDILPFATDIAVPVTEIEHAVLMPGLVDTHVHINEPGRTDWEGFDTATHAAAAGGITTLVDMPLNCIPVTTTAEALATKLAEVVGKLWVDCGYWGGAIPQNLADLPALLEAGVLGVKSFTIHSGIDEFPAVSESDLKAAMRILARYGLPYLIHAELDQGQVPNPAIGRSYQHFLHSRPRVWENDAIAMVIKVMRELTAEGLTPRAHIVHLSSSDALPLLQAARVEGLKLTAETCPHYLTLFAETIPDGITLFKCCPPIRENENRERLWQALQEGLIDMIVSDHSPCTPQLKLMESGDLENAWGGISALQFGLPLIWTEGQKRGFTLTDLAHLMCERPAAIAGIANKGKLAVGYAADFCVFDDKASVTISAAIIKHKHKISPYIGHTVSGQVLQTWLAGVPIFADDHYLGSARGRSLLRPNTPLPVSSSSPSTH